MNDPITTLELDQILKRAAAFASSEPGRQRICSLVPSGDFAEVKNRLDLTAEAEKLIVKYRYGGVESFGEVDTVLGKARAGATLSMGELLGIAVTMRSARLAKDTVCAFPDDVSRIKNILSQVSTDHALEEDIRKDIASDTEMNDCASDDLRQIRIRLRTMKSRLADKLASYTRNNAYSEYLQDNFYTVRGGRFVLPVKSEYRRNVQGLLHDQSATGSTLYIEPFEIVSMNNDIVKLEGDERREIERILEAFSARVLEHADDITDAYERLALVDTYMGLAGYSVSIDGIMPEINFARKVNLIGARHPLIDKSRVIPVDITVGGNFNILLISGPNTGGKTATLKTVGLLSLMLSVGLLLPCKTGSEMAVFDSIYCDIGDDQDISKDLSTFSSHIKNLKEITESFTNDSLILLDEIGSSTAPEEGSAIAIGVMDYIAETSAKAVITTHYPKLKEYAMTHAGIMNAGMQFDAQTLKPTYKILMGYPGSSNALETAAVLGLSPLIINKARECLGDGSGNYETLLKKAFEIKSRAEEELARAESERREVNAKLEKIAEDEKKVNEILNRINANAKAETKRLVNNAVEKANDIVEQIKQELKDADEKALLKAKRDLKRIEALAYDNGETMPSVLTEDLKENEIIAGRKVVIRSIGAEGYIAKVRSDRKEAEVNCAGKSLKVKFSDLAKPIETPRAPRGRKYEPQRTSEPVSVSKEINVIGETVADAIDRIEPWLDNAARVHLTELRIVHGKGTGALGKGIQSYLRSHPAVKSFRYGRYGEGDNGVTLVELKN